MILTPLVFILVNLERISFSETIIKIVDSEGKPLEGINLDIMYHCTSAGFHGKVYGVTSPQTTDIKGEAFFPEKMVGMRLANKESCWKTVNLLDVNNFRFEVGVTNRISPEDTEETLTVFPK